MNPKEFCLQPRFSFKIFLLHLFMCAVCMCVCRSEDNARIFFKHFFPRSGQMCIIDRCAPSPNFQPELEAQAWIQKQSSSFSAFLMLFFLFGDLFIFLFHECGCFTCLHDVYYTMPLEARKGHWISWSWSYRLVNCYACAGIQTWVLRKNSQCSQC